MDKETKLRRIALILFWIATARVLVWFVVRPHLADDLVSIVYMPVVFGLSAMYIGVCILHMLAEKCRKQND